MYLIAAQGGLNVYIALCLSDRMLITIESEEASYKLQCSL